MIENTSGNRDALLLSKELVRGITARCSEESYKKIEYKIIHFISANAKRSLKRRIELIGKSRKMEELLPGGSGDFFRKKCWGFYPVKG